MKWSSLFRSRRSRDIAEAQEIAALIEDFQNRNETAPHELTERLMAVVNNGRLPNELLMRLKAIPERGLEKSFHDYEAVVSNATKPVDLSQVMQKAWAAIEPGSFLDFMFRQIESRQRMASFPEAIFLQAVLSCGDPQEGPELRYLKERQRRGYPSLYPNEERLDWETRPGFYEKQLQLRHNNVLFPVGKRRVSLHDVYIARLLDREERNDFLEQWRNFRENVPDHIPASAADDVLRPLHDLLERSVLLGGDMGGLVELIHKAYQSILVRMYEERKEDPEAARQLQAAQEAGKIVLHPGCQLVRRTYDPADMLPAILSENDETFEIILEHLIAPNIVEFRNDVGKLMRESPEAREFLQRQPQKMALLGLKP